MNGRLHPRNIILRLILLMLTVLTVIVPEMSANVMAKDYSYVFNKARELQTQKIISIGDSLLEKGLSDKALVYYMVACNRLDDNLSEEELRQVALAHLAKGKLYYKKGGFARALQAFIEGIKICEGLSDQRELGSFYNNVGTIYCIFQEYEKGLSYYRKAREFNRKYGDRVNEYKTLANLTGVCTLLGRSEEAHRYFQESEKIKDTSDKNNNFMSRFNYALILMGEKKYTQASAAMRKCIDYGKTHGISPEYLCSAYKRMYSNYLKMGQRDSAQIYMRLCFDTSTRNGLNHKFAQVINDYAKVCHDNGDLARAYDLRSQYLHIIDSIYNMREFDIVKNSQFIYEMDKTDKQIASLNAKEEEHLRSISHQRTIIIVVIGVLLVVGALLIIVYRQKRLLNDSYNDLYTINRDFAATLENMRKEKESQCAPATEGIRKSSLDDDRRIALAQAVSEVMKNADEFTSPDFSLDRMAELVGSNSRYVSQVINDTFKKNFSNYVNEYRIRLACIRLSDTANWGNYTLKGIGESVGFRSYTTFVTVFRKITGLTPRLYQEKASKESLAEA